MCASLWLNAVQTEPNHQAKDFTQTAALRDTAERVQTILALITPGSAIYPPLDKRFNDFFRNLMSQYPQRITYVPVFFSLSLLNSPFIDKVLGPRACSTITTIRWMIYYKPPYSITLLEILFPLFPLVGPYIMTLA